MASLKRMVKEGFSGLVTFDPMIWIMTRHQLPESWGGEKKGKKLSRQKE